MLTIRTIFYQVDRLAGCYLEAINIKLTQSQIVKHSFYQCNFFVKLCNLLLD
jgi:hypothetical protein